VELEASEKDKEEVMERLLEFEDRFDEKVFERIAQEKEANRTMKLENNNLLVRVKDEQVRINQVERNRDEMSREMEELQNWKAAYEKDHGMQEMARGHKKLKEDNRRQAIAMEQMTTKMGEALDANGVLYQAFDRLKMEAGKSSDFMYDEYELKMDMLGDNAKLQAQVTELEDQVESLEEATIRLRQALKNQAGAVGEQGFKYAGLTADQLVKVNMFATNLRDGSIELPVDDRSAKLLRENHRLREEVDILRTSRVNSDMHSSSSNQGNQGNQQGNQQGTQPMMSKLGESEIFGLREDMQRLMNENSDLKTRMAGMMDELVGTIKASQSMGSRLPDAGEGGGQNSDALAAMVLANNDAMKKELLHELRKSQQMASSLSASMPRHMAPQAITNIHSHHHEAVTPGVAMTPAKQPFTPMVHGSQEAPMTMHHSQQPRFMYTGPMDGATPSLARPATPHGKKLLSKTLANLNLPPEEWATEVKELNGQLIECLEQLSEREGELDEQKGVIDSLEDNLVTIKQQMAALYHDYSQRVTAWETREKEYKQDNETLRNESDDLRLKVRRLKELSDTVSKESAQTMEQRVLDMGRKLIIYEVNENILTRKYNSVSGQLSQEQEQRHRHEMDIADIEGTLKRRILYLEQYKAAAGSRLARLQGKLDLSVPQGDYSAALTELDTLRDDHLKALQRELEARIASLKSSEQAQELRALRLKLAQVEGEVDIERCKSEKMVTEMEAQKQHTMRVLAAGDASPDMASLVSDMARYRGEASRLEVELQSANKRSGILDAQLRDVSKEYENALATHKDQDKRYEQAEQKVRELNKEKMDMHLKYEGGMKRSDADDMKAKNDKMSRELDELSRELNEQREIAEIASSQAQSIASLKDERTDELKELREYCNKLESRSDDELLIGRLQRQLMTTKTAYKAFIRKYQALRGNMRQRELAVRILETQLDQREKAVFNIQQTHRMEIGALKKALHSLDNALMDGTSGVDTSPGTEEIINGVDPLLQLDGVVRRQDATKSSGDDAASLGTRILSMSSKIGSLSTLAQSAVKRASEKEEEARRLAGDLQDRSSEVDILRARCDDLVMAANNAGGKQQTVASRLVALSEEVKTHKLSSLQQRRHINVLRQEKRHFQGLLASMTENVEGLEQGKVLAETKGLLSELGADEMGVGAQGVEGEEGETTVSDYRRLRGTLLNLNTDGSGGEVGSMGGMGDVSLIDDADAANSTTLLTKLESKAQETVMLRKELGTFKVDRERLQQENANLKGVVVERETQLKYYEGVVASEGLHTLQGRPATVASQQDAPTSSGRNGSNEKLQEAYSVKLSSIKTLLEDKKSECEKLRRQLDELNLKVARGQSAADKNAEALLARLDVEDSVPDRHKKGPGGVSSPTTPSQSARVGEDLNHAHDLIDDKQRELDQINQRLLAEANRRERAELRCDTALRETESMKSDLFTLANKLQESEERCLQLQRPTKAAAVSTNNGLVELQKQGKAKDEKIKGYREIIIRLKDEFIKSEEDKAIVIAREREKAKNAKSGGSSSNGPSTALSDDKLEELRSQVSALRNGLRQAKEDLESDRKVRDKLTKARQAALSEAEKLEEQVGRAEGVAAAAQEALGRCRRELEDSKKKEMRLRDKLKDTLAAGGGKGGEDTDVAATGKSSGGRASQLEREIEVLRAQNVALRKAVEEGGGSSSSGATRSPLDDLPTPASGARFGAPGQGNAVGGGNEVPKDDLRAQLHTKWESEKKLQKRVTQLEKRLKEKLQENADMETQLKRAKEATQSAQSSKDDAMKKAAAAMKSTQDMRKVATDDIDGVEGARDRVFKLEEELAMYKRKAEVEMAGEIAHMRHQQSTMREKMSDMEAELLESEAMRKKYASGMDSGAQLRDSEDRFMKQERLKEDLEGARRQRLELEAALLDRDSSAMESRFDLEARTQENERLRRRCRELESAYKAAVRNAGTHGSPRGGKTAWGDDAGTKASTATGKRERELESVVDAMKRVVDKLKADNERLRKSGGPDERRANELEKRAAMERKRAEKLDSEMVGLMEKLKVSEDASSRLTQRQNQVTQLKREIKAKDEEQKSILARLSSAEEDGQNHKRRGEQLEARIQQLEIQIASKATRDAGAAQKKGAGSKENDTQPLQAKTAQQAAEIETLKSELAESKRLLTAVRKESAKKAGPASSASLATAEVAGAELGKLRDSYRKVVGENEKLKEELSAFDLDFFEEIENLKYAHAEAMRKLRLYEN
jgi:centrosomal protein CEP290